MEGSREGQVVRQGGQDDKSLALEDLYFTVSPIVFYDADNSYTECLTFHNSDSDFVRLLFPHL